MGSLKALEMRILSLSSKISATETIFCGEIDKSPALRRLLNSISMEAGATTMVG